MIASAGVKDDTSAGWNIMQPLKPDSSLKRAYVVVIGKNKQVCPYCMFQLAKIIK